ncbi:MAG TPA: AtpZ/AtpI family protein [Patescibacteria group bacterium]|jgi:F0F1-type ATP synthase assembly protein I|nr:AtpZ/AtpI family protein [Patescibacteria group bacterium]
MADKNGRSEILRRAGPYLGLGSMFAASLLIGVGGGYWADGRFGTKPWLTIAGTMLGLVLGFYNFFAVVLRRPPGNGDE